MENKTDLFAALIFVGIIWLVFGLLPASIFLPFGLGGVMYKKLIQGYENLERARWINGELLFFLILFPFVFLVTYCSANLLNTPLWQEQFGIISDIALFGILLTFFRLRWERHDLIQQYQEDIDDLRYLAKESKEARYKVLGNVRRLKRLGVTKINLQDFCLEEVEEHSFYRALSITLEYNKGVHKDLIELNFSHSFLAHSSFRNATLWGCNFDNIEGSYSNFSGTDLSRSSFRNAMLFCAQFNNSDISGSNFIGANIFSLKLIEENGCAYNKTDTTQISTDFTNVKGIDTAIFDPGVKELIKEQFNL